MFTGLVEAIGTLTRAEPQTAAGDGGALAGRRLHLSTPFVGAESPAIGDSIAVDGVCLTVVAHERASGTCTMDAATETLARTTLRALAVGSRVHLERALVFGARLGGHLVSGHVDGVGTVHKREPRGTALYLQISAPPSVAALSAPQGAITLAGVSLTLTDVDAAGVWVALVPHTLEVTNLGALRVGDPVNCEADLLARYLARLLERRQPGP